MTTKVTIEAHCNEKTEVNISMATENTGENIRLQDGESRDFYVYDDREIAVKEVSKE